MIIFEDWFFIFSFKVPKFLKLESDYYEYFDSLEKDYGVEFQISSTSLGPIFGYKGRFSTEYIEVNAPI